MNLQLLDFIGNKLRPVEIRLLAKYVFRIRRKAIQLKDNSIYFIDPVSNLGLQLQKQGTYEPETTDVIVSLLSAGDTFVDLGCNEGYFSILAGKICGMQGKVFAIEPQERLWEIIKKNGELNGLSNIELIPYGIGAENGELLLKLYPSTNTGASSFSDAYNFTISAPWLRSKLYGTQLVKVVTLDHLRYQFPADIKLIKIDIEGFEYEALKGATMLLREKVFKNILIEIHPQALHGMAQNESGIDELLASYGYLKRVVMKQLNLYTLQ